MLLFALRGGSRARPAPATQNTTAAYHIYTLYVSCCCLLCVAGRAGAPTRRIDINNVYSSRFNKIRASARILIFLCKFFPDSAWKCSRTNNDNGSFFIAFMPFIAGAGAGGPLGRWTGAARAAAGDSAFMDFMAPGTHRARCPYAALSTKLCEYTADTQLQ